MKKMKLSKAIRILLVESTMQCGPTVYNQDRECMETLFKHPEHIRAAIQAVLEEIIC